MAACEAVPPLVAALVAGVRARRHPPRHDRARLALDAAALLAGLRPGVLLDYGGPAFRHEQGLAAFADGLTRLLRQCGGGRGCIALARLPACPDALPLGGPALFLVRLPLAGARVPWPVDVAPGSGPRWGDAAAADDLATRLAAVAAAADAAAALPGPPPIIDLPAAAVPHTALAAWLLGYPVALVAAADGGGGSASHLATSARLVALRASPPPGLASALRAAGWPAPPSVLSGGGGGDDDDTAVVDVCSFALPDPGAPPTFGVGAAPAATWLGEWVREVQARGAGTGWERVRAQTGSLGAGGLAL